MSISNPQPNHQYPTEQTLDLGINVDATGPASTSEEPAKRRPGRPKGSTKKNLLGTALPTAKVKRPVGRPRKDGMPAGSVGPTRQKRERQPTVRGDLNLYRGSNVLIYELSAPGFLRAPGR